MDRFGQREFEEMIGSVRSPLGRPGRDIASRAGKLVRKARLSAAKRIPFLLPVRGPLGDLDGGMIVSIYTISDDPLILYTPIGGARPLSTIAAIGRHLATRRATLLLSPNWTLERPAVVARMGMDLAWYGKRFPLHELIFLCNTEEERRLVEMAGGTAIVSNHNIMVSEQMFRPLPDVPVVFDAVYNARISHTKRHFLALNVERLVHITVSIGETRPAGSRAFIRRLQAQSPLHHIANPILDGMTARLTTPEINHVYNQAAVGLCLSAEEGAMYSSMEYLLAGLPIVSTPSLGGRDYFFDPDFCTIVEPQPSAVRRAVERLRDRALSREEIRGRTLERVRAARLDLTAYLSALSQRLAGSSPLPASFPVFGAGPLIREAKLRDHARRIAAFRPAQHGMTS
jgi:glycosyltransferase involved in cell wall biosynthesis